MPNTAKKACTTGKFGRLHYYHGMLLTEEDCEHEQTYFREKMKLHNRLHGYGVVWGLELKDDCIEIDGNKENRIFIEPGFALDCAGNEIIVCHRHLVPLDEKLDQLCQSCNPPEPNTKLLIAIKYCECKSDPQPQFTSQCADDELHPQMSRVCEGYCVIVLEEKDVSDCCKDVYAEACCEKPMQNCPGLAGCCETDHVIILGCIIISPEDCKERNLKESDLDPCCKPRRVCTPCGSPQSRWEHQKQSLIHEACVTHKWVDFSGIVGKSVSKAEGFLEKIGLTPGGIKPIDEYDPNKLMGLVTHAVSCAPRNSAITLITDTAETCVLFAVHHRYEE